MEIYRSERQQDPALPHRRRLQTIQVMKEMGKLNTYLDPAVTVIKDITIRVLVCSYRLSADMMVG